MGGKQEVIVPPPLPNIRPTRVWVAPDDHTDEQDGLSTAYDAVVSLVKQLGGRLDTNDAYKRVLDNLDPESRQRIIERVPANLRPH